MEDLKTARERILDLLEQAYCNEQTESKYEKVRQEVKDIFNTLWVKHMDSTTDDNELAKTLRYVIAEHGVTSYWIEAFRGKGYDDKMDKWVNTYYIEERLNHPPVKSAVQFQSQSENIEGNKA